MEGQEEKLLEVYRKLRPESKNLILSTIMTAVMAEEAAIREHGLLSEIQAPINQDSPAELTNKSK
jgi:hypothetical protein